MTQQEIIEGNKLIAEFCNVGYWQVWRKNGYKPHWADKYTSPEAALQAVDIHYGMESMRVEFEPKFITPKYESDWNELMPVVEKIEGLGYSVFIQNDCCWIRVARAGMRLPHISNLADSKIEATNMSIVEFIKWYNQNK